MPLPSSKSPLGTITAKEPLLSQPFAGSEPTTEYGYTDLGIIQDFRRQYLEAAFPYHTNDLALALRLYNLRKQYLNNLPVYAELDRAFTNIIAGNLATASLQLSGIESSRPVIYDLLTNSNQLQFSIGGYLADGVQVQVSTNLTTWQTAQTFAATTNLLLFSAPTPPRPVCRFFKVLP